MVDLAQKHSQWTRFFAKAGAVVLVAGVLGAGARFAYVKFFPNILVKEARAAIAKGEYRNAALEAQRAYQIRHSDVDAMRLMADIAEQDGQYVALEWRKKILEFVPDSVPDILACASAALRFGQPQVAKETLAHDGIPTSNARYWALEASADNSLGNMSDAEREAEEAVRLEPSNEDYQLTLASVELKTRRAEVRDAARATLEGLTKSPRLKMAAERLLIEDSVANGELSAARKLSEAVVSGKDSQFYDQLMYLNILKRSGDAGFQEYLGKIEAGAGLSPSDTGTLIGWMRSVGLNEQAYEWVRTLPVAVTRTAEAGPFVAWCYADTGHWQELHDLIKDANWGKSEYQRNAFLARTAEKLGNRIEYDLASNAAMGGTTGNSQAQCALAEMELEWGWSGESQRTLSDIVKSADNREYLEWALKNLYRIYQKKGDVVQLAIVTQKMAELKPDDDIIQNNFVMFSLLTRSNLLTVLPLAEALYKRHSADPVFVSTYAYSLLVHGDKDQAMKVIMTLPEEDKRSQSVAAYCGIILAANKEKETAKTYLDLVNDSKLLPQEAILVNAARTEIR